MVAWFPWKSEETGEARCDSTGIFICNVEVIVDLCCELSQCHDNDATGLFFKDRSGGLNQTESGTRSQMWATVFEKGGPGQAFSAYLPKDVGSMTEKLRPTLEKLTDNNPILRMKEKRTSFEFWKYGGIRKGAHFPLLVFTDTPGRRRTQQSKDR